jgi:hypothetical protein
MKTNLIYPIWLTLLFNCIYNNVSAQDDCSTPDPPPGIPSNINCNYNYLNYIENAVSIYDAPLLIINVNVHVMQPVGGTANFPNNQAAKDYLTKLFVENELISPYTLNFSPYGHNVDPTYVIIDPTTSLPYPVLYDTRIRFKLNDIYYHEDDIGWTNNNNKCNSYVYTNYGINKGKELNIFFIDNR